MIDINKPLRVKGWPDIKLEFIRTLNNNYPYLFLFKFHLGTEKAYHVERDGKICEFPYDTILENIPEDKFDPEKPAKFAKKGDRSSPRFLGYINKYKDCPSKLVYSYFSKELGVELCASFTIDGYCRSSDIGSEKEDRDLINI